MNQYLYENHLLQLKSHLKMALGCTEPIAIAYAAATARDALLTAPTKMLIECSGNIIKNVQGVVVPNSGGLRGVNVAAVLGLVGGDATKQLEALASIQDAHLVEVNRLLESDFCTCVLKEGVENLYIRVVLEGENSHSSEVIMKDYHTNITYIRQDVKVLHQVEDATDATVADHPSDIGDPALLTLENIFQFADEVSMDDVAECIQNQIDCNSAISQEGLKNGWGAQVGRVLMAVDGVNLVTRARAAAAAGSDARMGGCTLPAVINSGSGNQGITLTLPLCVYAEEYNIPKEKLIRALVVANLVSIHQKKYIGNLSAYCGAVSAAAGSACGIAYMTGESIQVAADTLTNTVATVGGMVCDGAKASCAAKISAAVDTALTSLSMAKLGFVFQAGEGIVKQNVEQTIQSIGQMAKDGMKSTDVEILNIMLA